MRVGVTRQAINAIENGKYDPGLPLAMKIARALGYPVLIRPSYVLGGRAMEMCNNDSDLEKYAKAAFAASDLAQAPKGGHTVLVDKFLLDAMEIDVDAVADFKRPSDSRGECVIAGVMEHIEEAGIHSGDSSCVLPPATLGAGEVDRVRASRKR